MDTATEQTLARILRLTRIAALGTLHDGEPNQSMVSFATAGDFSAFYILVSRLGRHTRDMEADSRVSLMIAETDDHRPDPQTLARVSIQGTATIVPRDAAEYAPIRSIYLDRFPEAGQFFSLGDFNLWQIRPKGGRFVAGFGRAFNLVPDALKKASTVK